LAIRACSYPYTRHYKTRAAKNRKKKQKENQINKSLITGAFTAEQRTQQILKKKHRMVIGTPQSKSMKRKKARQLIIGRLTGIQSRINI